MRRGWFSSGLSWSAGDSVSLTLTEPPASTDATLSDLALEDNNGNTISLTAGATRTYTASVVNSVDEITVLPTVNDSNATYEIQDGDGTALTDADTNTTGIQVAIDEGENKVKVEVTAEDGSTILTYTITVTRDDTTPPAPPPRGTGSTPPASPSWWSSTRTSRPVRANSPRPAPSPSPPTALPSPLPRSPWGSATPTFATSVTYDDTHVIRLEPCPDRSVWFSNGTASDRGCAP